jgi:hypothetical protein
MSPISPDRIRDVASYDRIRDVASYDASPFERRHRNSPAASARRRTAFGIALEWTPSDGCPPGLCHPGR